MGRGVFQASGMGSEVMRSVHVEAKQQNLRRAQIDRNMYPE
jgi:hypothetical protein